MNLIGTELGRVALLFSPEENRPLSGIYPPDAFRLIQERYHFAYSPDLTRPWEEVQKDGLKFKLGKFSVEGKDAAITELVVYGDGIVVNAFTTEDAEAFLNDLIDWGLTTLGLRTFHRPPRRIYVSQVTVEFEASVNHLIAKFDDVTHLFSNLLNETYHLNVSLELQSIGFDYDRLVVSRIHDLARFAIERRSNTKYEDRIFWCQAPLHTVVHIEALKTLEKFLESEPASKAPKK